MKETILTIDNALSEVLNMGTDDLAKKMNVNYNTISSWKFNYKHNAMSYEKKMEILTKMGYNLTEQSKWKKNQK
jgi:hypothetical protein